MPVRAKLGPEEVVPFSLNPEMLKDILHVRQALRPL